MEVEIYHKFSIFHPLCRVLSEVLFTKQQISFEEIKDLFPGIPILQFIAIITQPDSKWATASISKLFRQLTPILRQGNYGENNGYGSFLNYSERIQASLHSNFDISFNIKKWYAK